MKTPVRLDPLPARRRKTKFTQNLFPPLPDQFRALVQHPFEQVNSSQPHLVLPGHHRPGAVENRPELLRILRRQVVAEQKQGVEQLPRRADFGIPPVRTLRIPFRPEVEPAQNGRQQFPVPEEFRFRRGITGGEQAQTGQMLRRMPTSPPLMPVIDSGPGAVCPLLVQCTAYPGVADRLNRTGIVPVADLPQLPIHSADSERQHRQQADSRNSHACRPPFTAPPFPAAVPGTKAEPPPAPARNRPCRERPETSSGDSESVWQPPDC